MYGIFVGGCVLYVVCVPYAYVICGICVCVICMCGFCCVCMVYIWHSGYMPHMGWYFGYYYYYYYCLLFNPIVGCLLLSVELYLLFYLNN